MGTNVNRINKRELFNPRGARARTNWRQRIGGNDTLGKKPSPEGQLAFQRLPFHRRVAVNAICRHGSPSLSIPRGCFRFRRVAKEFARKREREREAKIRNTTTTISTNPLIYGSRATSRIVTEKGEGGKWRRSGTRAVRKGAKGERGKLVPFGNRKRGFRWNFSSDASSFSRRVSRQRWFTDRSESLDDSGNLRSDRLAGRSDDPFLAKKEEKRENRLGFSTSIAANFRRFSPRTVAERFSDDFSGRRIFLSFLWNDFLSFFLFVVVAGQKGEMRFYPWSWISQLFLGIMLASIIEARDFSSTPKESIFIRRGLNFLTVAAGFYTFDANWFNSWNLVTRHESRLLLCYVLHRGSNESFIQSFPCPCHRFSILAESHDFPLPASKRTAPPSLFRASLVVVKFQSLERKIRNGREDFDSFNLCSWSRTPKYRVLLACSVKEERFIYTFVPRWNDEVEMKRASFSWRIK